VSEYQYYEFQAIDRPLTESQMWELRKYSTRATITPTSFINVYNWGDFKGNRHEWMEKYFDAFLYVANWGSHWIQFRVPKRLLKPESVSAYCTVNSLACHTKGDFVIVSFASDDECGEWSEGEGWLASLTPVRAGLLEGDLRSLYLGWLVSAQEGLLQDDNIEPAVPPGLGTLTSPLQTLADFLRIDRDWIAAAAEESAKIRTVEMTRDEIVKYVAMMPPKEKDAVIATLLEGSDLHFEAELRQRAAHEIRSARNLGDENTCNGRRTVRELASRADTVARERQAREAKACARDKAKRERERAEARKKHLESLVGKEDALWSKVDALIRTKQPKRYDEAVSLLQDLRDLAGMCKQDGSFAARMEILCREQTRKPSLLERIRKGHLMGGEQ